MKYGFLHFAPLFIKVERTENHLEKMIMFPTPKSRQLNVIIQFGLIKRFDEWVDTNYESWILNQ